MKELQRTAPSPFCVWALASLLPGAIIASHAGDSSGQAASDRGYLPWEKGSVKIGGFFASFNTELAFGLEANSGIESSAEDAFGLESSLTVFRAEAMYRPGKSLRHQFDFAYFGFDRDGSTVLTEEVEIRGETYPVGARIDSVFNFDIIRGTYSYAFLQNERVRLGVGLGVYAIPLEYGLNIETAGGRSTVEGADTTLPLPALAVRGEFQIIPRLFLNAAVDGMYVEFTDFKGSLMDLNLGLEYRPWKHVGFGVGYNRMAVRVEGENDDSNYPGANFVGTADVRFNGLMLYGKFSF